MIRVTLLAVVSLTLAAVPAVAEAQISVVGATIHQRDARPGETYTGSFTVRNESSEPQDAMLYLTDYAATADGAYRYGEPGGMARSNAAWITLERPRITIPPRRTVTVPFTVTLPVAPKLGGSHWSMIMVEAVSPASSAAATGITRDVAVGLVTKLRYAVQVVTNVPGEARRSVQFARPTIAKKPDDARELSFDVVNDGTLAFVPAMSVELYSESGELVGRFAATRELTYPGNSLRAAFDLGQVRAGNYQALVIVNAGADEAFGAQFTLRF